SSALFARYRTFICGSAILAFQNIFSLMKNKRNITSPAPLDKSAFLATQQRIAFPARQKKEPLLQRGQTSGLLKDLGRHNHAVAASAAHGDNFYFRALYMLLFRFISIVFKHHIFADSHVIYRFHRRTY